MQAEQAILSEGEIQVTTHRIVIGGTTYAVANITSVRQGSDGPSFFPFLGTFVFGLLGVGSCLVREFRACGLVLLVLSAICGLIVYLSKASHWLRITTAGVETQALASPDGAYVTRVSGAIQRAIAMR